MGPVRKVERGLPQILPSAASPPNPTHAFLCTPKDALGGQRRHWSTTEKSQNPSTMPGIGVQPIILERLNWNSGFGKIWRVCGLC